MRGLEIVLEHTCTVSSARRIIIIIDEASVLEVVHA
uniref:Uncharacterized protein n=1 Tax=Arundo donax TaxID=35708 RepID=A0A0A9DRM3_ARUDO